MKRLDRLRSIAGRLVNFSRRLLNTLLAGGPASRTAATIITRELNQARGAFEEEMARLTPIADGLQLEDVRRYMTAEAERRKGIDDKAKSNLMAITLSITVLLGGLNSVGKNELAPATSNLWSSLALGLLILGVAYLMFAGLKAIDALRIAETFNPSPEDESGLPEVKRKAQLLWCLGQNQRISLLRTNSVSVSHQSLINGIVCLAILVVVIALRMLCR
jgi:hypothetical protein